MDHRALFRLLPWPAVVVDRELIVRDVTDSFATATGSTPDDLVGRALYDVLAQLLQEIPAEDVRSALMGDAPYPRSVLARDSGSPEPRQFRMQVVPAGEDGALVCFGPDTEGFPSGTSERLETLSAALRSIKHEINNPLTGALGNINMLLRREDWDEKTRKRLTTAEQEMKKIGQIVIRLSDLVPPVRLSSQNRGRSA